MRHVAWRAALAAVAAATMSLGSGCVAFNVGKPEVYTHTETLITTNKMPSRTEVLSVEAKAQAEGNCLKAWLDAKIEEEFPRWEQDETVTVKAQKRMAVGVFPALAKYVDAPPKALPHGGFLECVLGSILSVGIANVYGAFDTLLVEPFSNHKWKTFCQFDWPFMWTKGVLSTNYLIVTQICPKTGMTVEKQSHSDDMPLSHKVALMGEWGLVGVYKYQDLVVEPAHQGKPWKSTSYIRSPTRSVPGPYEVELRILGTGIGTTARVEAWDNRATFDLPRVGRGGAYEATLTFRSLYTGTDAVRTAWDKKTLTTTVWLQENAPSAYSPPQQPVREVVREIHYVEVEKKPAGASWEIETVKDNRAGQAVYLVHIRDGTKTAAEVESEVRPLVERNLREAFLAAMPGMDEGRVRVYVVAKYEGRAIRFWGVAFTAVPTIGGWRYDQDTHRGFVRLRISRGMSAEAAKRWARENIEAIVKEKNVALEAGAALPSGAVYRSLGETLESGVLTVEFEAVE